MMIGGQVVARHQDKQQQSTVSRKHDSTNPCMAAVDIRRPVERNSTGESLDARQDGHSGSRDAALKQQQQQTTTREATIHDEGNSKHSVLSGQLSDDNSTGSWSANSLNCGAGGSARRALGGSDRRLSVILPQSQKSLLTPTIEASEQGATPNPLFSSLIQLNGQEVGLFTGLPSCTPTSADGLARANINPFFWGVQQRSPHVTNADQHQQHFGSNDLSSHMAANYNQSSEQQTNKASTKGVTGAAAAAATESKERRRHLSKLSMDQLQPSNAMILSSPLTSFLLSPENEAWLRLNLQNHPLSGKNGTQIGCCGHLDKQQHHATELVPPSSQAAAYATLLEDHEASQHPMSAYSGRSSRTAQDLTSNQMIALRLSNGVLDNAATNHTTQTPISSQSATVCTPQHHAQAITTSPQYNTSCYNAIQHQQPVSIPTDVVPITSSNSFPASQQQQQQHHQQQLASTRSPDFVPNSSSQLIYQHQMQAEGQQPSAGTHYAHSKPTVMVPISDQQGKIAIVRARTPGTLSSSLSIDSSASSERRSYLDGGDLVGAQRVAATTAGAAQSSMGPPAAHHHHHHHQLQLQPQSQQHQHQGSPLLVMGTHHLDPRFVDFQHHHPLDYDGAKVSIGLYEPHLQQIFLAQKHQQEIYNLHQHQQHNQQQYLNYHNQQQQALPSYHLMPNGQAHMGQHHLQQQQPQQLPPKPAATTGYLANQIGSSHEAMTDANGTATNNLIDDQNHTSTAHHTDFSSNSNSLSTSANVSPRRQDQSSQSCNNSSLSARSSVSRDTNSIDVIATSGSKATSVDAGRVRGESAIHRLQARANSTKLAINSKQATRQQAIKKTENKLGPLTGGTKNGDVQVLVVKKKSKGGRKKKVVTNEELVARKNRSKERNRVAAKRCRQKRKQFLDELRGRIDNLNDLNKKLSKENNQLKGELEQLRKHHKVWVAN